MYNDRLLSKSRRRLPVEASMSEGKSFAVSEGERNALLLFHRSGGNGSQFTDFTKLLQTVELPFPNFLEKVRKLDFPGYPSFKAGLPSVFYYFIPGTKWSSEKNSLNPLDDGFIESVDGFGLNLGCPLRLKRAVEILNGLPATERAECKRNLKEATVHLSTVEELLCLDLWPHDATVSRSEGTSSKTHDWIINIGQIRLRQECKLRPVEWARVADGTGFVPKRGVFCGRAAKQLPNPPEVNTTNVVTIIGLGQIDDHLLNIVATELHHFPNVEVLIYQNMVGDGAIFSFAEDKARMIHEVTRYKPALNFQPLYYFVVNLSKKAKRHQERAKEKPTASPPPSSVARPFRLDLKVIPSPTKIEVPYKGYRLNIHKRHSDGEPEFTVVPPELSTPPSKAGSEL
jgi:hypothetical protein